MLRALFKADTSQILAIEQSAHVMPWTEETFKMCFQAGYLGWVWEEQKKILGFIIVSQTQEECHVLNLCVAKDKQHQGLGRLLMQQAVQYAKKAGIRIMYLEVRRSNTKAIALYRKLQFHLVGQRKDYYPTPQGVEDALVFAKSLVEESDTLMKNC